MKQKTNMSQAITFRIDIFLRLKKTDKAVGYIYARLTVCGKATEISLHEKINAIEWDYPREKVRGNRIQVKALNTHIENVRFRIREKYRLLMEKEQEISAEAIKEAYLGTHQLQFKGHRVIELLEYHMKMKPGQLMPGTLKNYVSTEAYIRNFIKAKFGQDDVFLKSLNVEFITELEHFIRNTPVKKHDPCVGNGVMSTWNGSRKWCIGPRRSAGYPPIRSKITNSH